MVRSAGGEGAAARGHRAAACCAALLLLVLVRSRRGGIVRLAWSGRSRRRGEHPGHAERVGTGARAGRACARGGSGACARGQETGEKEGERRKEKKEKKKRKGKGKKEEEIKREEKKEKRSAARFAAGGRAWATSSRAARDGTAARKKRESEVRSAEKGEEKVER